MNKDIFLNQLKELLSDLNEDERIQAMSYYEEYFIEAGEENEQQVLRELGSAQEVSYKIHDELADKLPAVIEIDEEEETVKKEKKPVNGWKIACIVLACILLGPIVIPIILALFVTGIALFVAAIAVVVAVAIAVFVVVCLLLIVAVVLFIYGVTRLLIMPMTALLLIGLSFLALGLFVAFGWLAIKLCAVCIPAVCKGIVKLFSLPFQRKASI